VNKDSLRYLRHELRTLLNHIMGYSEILKEEHGLGGDPKDELQELYLESEKLIDIFKRSFYQGESVRVDFNPGIFKQNLFGPLYNIIGLTQRLKQRWEKENRLEGAKDIQKILESSRKTLELVEAELSSARLGEGNRDFGLQPPTMPMPQREDQEEHSPLGRILVVDDNEANREILVRHLERQGHRVSYVENGYRCLQVLGEKSFDLILLDIMMPGMNGYQVLDRLKADAKLRHIPVIMISALEEMDSVAHCISLGAEDYLPKSFNPLLLKARISSCLIKKKYRDKEQKYLQALIATQQNLEKELAEAAEYVRGLLPAPITGEVEANWLFIPSAKLGGDCFDYHWLDDENLAVYLLDVSGHGIGAALLSVSVMNVLRSQSLPNANFFDPSEVLEALNQSFKMEEQNNMYFTIWYGVYNTSAREISFASAGAPPALLVRSTEPPEMEELTTNDMIIGVDNDYQYETRVHAIPVDSRLYLFSDGAFEVRKTNGSMMVFKEFSDILTFQDGALENNIQSIVDQIRGLSAEEHFEDDFSLLELRLNKTPKDKKKE
jgi:sigma-B regulation protein RsbU (phosphoserine phosphatase)